MEIETERKATIVPYKFIYIQTFTFPVIQYKWNARLQFDKHLLWV